MHLPIKIATSHHVGDVLDFYGYYARFKNFRRFSKLPTYFDGGDQSDGYVCYEYYKDQLIHNVKDSIVFIDALKEGWHVLPNQSRGWPKDKHYFLISGADWDTEDPKYQLPVDYTLLYFPWVLFDTVRTFTSFKHELFFSNITYDFVYPKPVNFCSMSAGIKPHRDYVIENLLPQIDHSHYSVKYAGQQFGVDINDLDIVKKISYKDTDHYHREANSLFDGTRGKELHVMSWQHMPIDIYNISYYNLITESNQEGSHFFPTEKIWKPILAGIPFVCIATQNFLKRVRDLGFKTYDTVWDESYDEEENDKTRLAKAAELCLQLENFDWNKNKDKLVEIALHNRIQWSNVSQIFIDCFIGMENSIEQFRNRNV